MTQRDEAPFHSGRGNLEAVPAQPSKEHIPVLDGLRGIAVLLVLLDHINLEFGGLTPPSASGRFLATIFGAGWIGVDLFFALSGFLITSILLDTRGDRFYFRNFYARRALRIMPLYYGYLGGVLFLYWIASRLGRHISVDLQGVVPSIVFYYYNFWSAFGQHPPVFHHFWSLSVEEHFYLIWPAMVCLLDSSWLKRVCVLGVLFSLAARIAMMALGYSESAVLILTPCRLDGLLLGAFLAISYSSEREALQIARWAPAVLAISGSCLFGMASQLGQFSDIVSAGAGSFALRPLFLGLFFSALLAVAMESAKSEGRLSWLAHPALRKAGKYSYGMYVLHMSVMLVALAPLSALAQRRHWPDWIMKPIGMVLLTALTFGAAWVSYRLLESRFLRLKHLFPRRSTARIAIL